jgi:hypothetical protein
VQERSICAREKRLRKSEAGCTRAERLRERESAERLRKNEAAQERGLLRESEVAA